MTMEYPNNLKDFQNQTELMITLNLYNERYFITEWKEIFAESKKKNLRYPNISQVMSRKPLYSEPFSKSNKKNLRYPNISQVMYRKPIYLEPSSKSKVTLLDMNIYFVPLIMEIPEGKSIGISGISKNWKPKKLQNTLPSPIVNQKQEMRKYIEIEPEKTKRIFDATHTQENKKQNYHPRSQSSYRPQRYEIRRNQF